MHAPATEEVELISFSGFVKYHFRSAVKTSCSHRNKVISRGCWHFQTLHDLIASAMMPAILHRSNDHIKVVDIFWNVA